MNHLEGFTNFHIYGILKLPLVIDFRLSELSFLNFCFPHLFASCTLALLSYKMSVPKLEDTMLLTFVGRFCSVNNDTD